MDKILEVNNLKISFRTQGGTVKAVRDISFDLERGETLAIVGESGSGKSVTSKAILGILAGNSIIEGAHQLRIRQNPVHHPQYEANLLKAHLPEKPESPAAQFRQKDHPKMNHLSH